MNFDNHVLTKMQGAHNIVVYIEHWFLDSSILSIVEVHIRLCFTELPELLNSI
jgi:hypothetical protein